jgi:hypothetical protein
MILIEKELNVAILAIASSASSFPLGFKGLLFASSDVPMTRSSDHPISSSCYNLSHHTPIESAG